MMECGYIQMRKNKGLSVVGSMLSVARPHTNRQQLTTNN